MNNATKYLVRILFYYYLVTIIFLICIQINHTPTRYLRTPYIMTTSGVRVMLAVGQAAYLFLLLFLLKRRPPGMLTNELKVYLLIVLLAAVPQTFLLLFSL